jgi:hypothetical protein
MILLMKLIGLGATVALGAFVVAPLLGIEPGRGAMLSVAGYLLAQGFIVAVDAVKGRRT